MSRCETKRSFLDQLFRGVDLVAMLQSLSAEHVMTVCPTAVEPNTPAHQVVRLFYELQFRHLLVTENRQLVGVISDRDAARLFGLEGSANPHDLQTYTARDLMSTDLLTVTPQTPLCEAVRVLLDNGINCLPVVSQGIPLGILTTTDLYLVLEQVLESARSARLEQSAAS
jgi:acetoin utilization protein AcuB